MSLIAKHQNFRKELIENGKTPAEVSAMFEELVANRMQLCVEIDRTYTLAELKRKTYRADSKKQAVSAVANQMIDSYATFTGRSIAYFLEGDLAQAHLKAQRENIAQMTQQEIDEYVANVKADRQARIDEQQKRAEALVNPQTIWDYQRLAIERGGEEKFTDDELRDFDRLHFEEIERKEVQEKVEKVEAVELPESTCLTLKKSWHTKRACDIWLVQLNERVEREKYNELAEKALKFGARWNNFPRNDTSNHGFLFWSEEEAQAFMKLAEGENVTTAGRVERKEQERRAKASDRLLDFAERNISQAEQELNRGRLVNTWRRMNIANSVEASARESLAFAHTVASVAQVVGDEPDSVLGVVRYASHLQTLCYLLNKAWGKAAAAEQEKLYVSPENRRPIEPEDIRYTVYPWPNIRTEIFRKVVLQTKGKKGVSEYRRRLSGMSVLSNGMVTLNNHMVVSAFQNLLGKLSLSHYEKQTVNDALAHYSRLKAMGIMNLPALRHVLRALLPYFASADKPDPLVQAERSLLGLDIPGYFPTPIVMVNKMVQLAEMRQDEDYRILEPSAGKGNIADVLAAMGYKPDCIEVNYRLRQILTMKGHNLVGDDFLEYTPAEPYHRILMNPPFENGQDFQHIRHALTMLRPGGVLVSVVANGATYAKNKEWLAEVGCKADIEVVGGAFRESGTGVATRIISIVKQ